MRAILLASTLALGCAREATPNAVTLVAPTWNAPPPPLECSPRDPNACQVLGHRLLATDPRRAYMFESIACEHGVTAGCATLGWMMLHGTWGDASSDEAFPLLDGSCHANVAASCVDLGVLALDDRREDDARAIFERYCARDVGAACDELGRMVEEGRRFAPDASAAKRLFEHACHAGSASGCGDLARLTNDAKMLEDACHHHDGRACYELGKRAKDAKEESARYERGCNLGVSEACVEMSLLAPPDSASSSWWLGRACEERNASACARLGWRIGSTALHERARALGR